MLDSNAEAQAARQNCVCPTLDGRSRHANPGKVLVSLHVCDMICLRHAPLLVQAACSYQMGATLGSAHWQKCST